MGMCAIICTSPGSPLARDVETSKALDERVAYLTAKNRFATMGRLHDKNREAPSGPRKSPVSYTEPIHEGPVDDPPDDKPGDFRKLLSSIPKQPVTRKECDIVRIELPEIVESKSPATERGSVCTEINNGTVEVFEKY